jgi:hypothetical protein
MERALMNQKPQKGKEENLNLKQLKNSLNIIESLSSQSSGDYKLTESVKAICKNAGIKVTRT